MGTKRTNEQAEDMAVGTVIFVDDSEYDPKRILHKVDHDTWEVLSVYQDDPGVRDYDVNADLNPDHVIVGTTTVEPPNINTNPLPGDRAEEERVVQAGEGWQQGKGEDIPRGTVHLGPSSCPGGGKECVPGTISPDGEVAKCPACKTNQYLTDVDGSVTNAISPHLVPQVVVQDGIDRLLDRIGERQRADEETETDRWIYVILLELKVLKRNLEHHTHTYAKPTSPPGVIERPHITTPAHLPDFRVGKEPNVKDPVAEAAQRVCPGTDSSTAWAIYQTAEAGAREALQPIRDLYLRWGRLFDGRRGDVPEMIQVLLEELAPHIFAA